MHLLLHNHLYINKNIHKPAHIHQKRHQETELYLTSTENCKSLLVLTMDLNSTYKKEIKKIHFRESRRKNAHLHAESKCTLEQHRLPISCSTPIDTEGRKFNFPASLWVSLPLGDAWFGDIPSSAKSLVNNKPEKTTIIIDSR